MQVRYRYQKETPTHVFSCEICEITKNIFFYKTPPAAATSSASNKCSMPLVYSLAFLDFLKHTEQLQRRAKLRVRNNHTFGLKYWENTSAQ